MDAKAILFLIFSGVMLLAAVRVITARNPVHAVLFLVLAFFSAACLWILLAAEFLAIALVLVYVGAVMVLFLFVVMMLDINVDRLRQGFWRHVPWGVGIAALIVLQMWLVLSQPAWQGMNRAGPGIAGVDNIKALGRLTFTEYVFPLQIAGVDPAGGHHRRDRADAARAQGLEVAGSVAPGQGAPGRPGASGGDAHRERRAPDQERLTGRTRERERGWFHCPGTWVWPRCCSRSASSASS